MRTALLAGLVALYGLTTLFAAGMSAACNQGWDLCGNDERDPQPDDPWWYRNDAWQWDAFAALGVVGALAGLVFLAVVVLAPERVFLAAAALAAQWSIVGVTSQIAPVGLSEGPFVLALVVLVPVAAILLYVRVPRQIAGVRRE